MTMSASSKVDMDFVPMTSISKKSDQQAHKCSDWVATEKVHGSSFQFYTDDGVKVRPGSRRRSLDHDESFIRCNIKELMKKYEEFALRTWDIIHSRDRWEVYREPSSEYKNTDDCSDNDESAVDENSSDEGVECDGELCRVRIYGELYGGGGIDRSAKSAAQKEIIYCDEFRFYVFGLTINKKWVNVLEMNDLCREAGFPYYARPVCEPKQDIEELKEHLTETGFMKSRSALSEKKDDMNTNIEGVVMTPLKRPDFGLHAVKFLAPAFTDVKESNFGATKTANFCTKQRYHSVISKLDIDERNNTKMVVDMFIEDILKESQMKNVYHKMRAKWAAIVTEWLAEDEYKADKSVAEEIARAGCKKSEVPREIERNKDKEEKKRLARKSQRENLEATDENDGEPFAMGLFD